MERSYLVLSTGTGEGVVGMKVKIQMIEVAEQVTCRNGEVYYQLCGAVPWGEPEALSLALFAIGKGTKM